MFSDRLPRDFEKNPLTRLLEKKRAEGAPIADLTQSNPTRAGIPYPEDAVAAIFKDAVRGAYAPDPKGTPAAREAVCAHLARRGARVRPEDVHLTAGTSEAYAHLFKILCDPGDTVLLPSPSYPLFESLCELEGVRTARFPLERTDGGWRPNLDAFARATRGKRVRAALFVHPNNPTGNLLRADDFKRIAAICAERQLALIVDEVFLDYADAPTPDALGTLSGCDGAPLLFVLNGLSKTVGMPQLKLAWIVTSGDPALAAQARERLDIVNDTFLSCATPVQNALGALLQCGQSVRDAIAARCAQNFRALEAAGLFPFLREGGWYAVLPLPARASQDEFVLTLLETHNVLAHPGFFYDFPEDVSALVVSLLPPPEVFAQGIAGIAAVRAACV